MVRKIQHKNPKMAKVAEDTAKFRTESVKMPSLIHLKDKVLRIILL